MIPTYSIAAAPPLATQTPSVGTSNGYGNAASIAQTSLQLAEIASSDLRDEDKIQAMRDTVALAVADAYTFGFASVGYKYMNKYLPGVMEGIRKFDSTFNIGTVLINTFFTSDKWKTEGDRLEKLLDNGVAIPESLQLPMQLQRGRTTAELVDLSTPPDFVGYNAEGSWVNNRFALSRNVTDLQPEDIWGYSAFFEKFGNDWLGRFSESDRRAIAGKALELGAVEEHHGTIDVSWTPELEAFIG